MMIARRLTILATASLFSFPAFARQGPPPAQVRVDPVRSEVVQERRVVTGEVRPVRRSFVAAREPGLVLELSARAGAALQVGEIVARLDSGRLELALATLRTQRASAEVEVEQRREEADQAQRDLETTRELVQKKTVGEKRLVDATSALRVATLVVAQAESRLNVLAAEQAELERRVDDMLVRAPFNGVVVSRLTEVGEWLAVGEALAEMVSVEELEVWLDVPQRYAAALARGAGLEASIDIRIDALDMPVVVLGGRMVPQVDARARTFKYVVALRPANVSAGAITAGMSVTASVPTGARGKHWTVARDAVLRGEAGSYLYLVRASAGDAPAQAARIPIEELFNVNGRVAVRAAALKAGDQAVVEGNERLFPGAPVIAAPAGDRAGGK
ncbi:MAG: RND family efflux transporter MFP subunit [Chlamydiales bacterium]|jgi:RND family efflux transporter MFP subunit